MAMQVKQVPSQNQSAFSDIEILALSKAAGSDEVVKRVREGFGNNVSYPVDFKVHIKGDINIGASGIRQIPNRSLTKVNFGLALSKLNEATVKTLLDAFSEVLKEGKKEEYKDAELKDYVRNGLDTLFAATSGIQDGAVKFKGQIVPIES